MRPERLHELLHLGPCRPLPHPPLIGALSCSLPGADNAGRVPRNEVHEAVQKPARPDAFHPIRSEMNHTFLFMSSDFDTSAKGYFDLGGMYVVYVTTYIRQYDTSFATPNGHCKIQAATCFLATMISLTLPTDSCSPTRCKYEYTSPSPPAICQRCSLRRYLAQHQLLHVLPSSLPLCSCSISFSTRVPHALNRIGDSIDNASGKGSSPTLVWVCPHRPFLMRRVSTPIPC